MSETFSELEIESLGHRLRSSASVIRRYKESSAAAKKHAEAQAVLRELSVETGHGLPDGYVLVSSTSGMEENRVYLHDKKTDEWRYRSTIDTQGAGYAFMGDKIEISADDEIVLINTELGLGLEIVSQDIELQEVDKLHSRSRNKRFAELINMINKSPEGKLTRYDCLWM